MTPLQVTKEGASVFGATYDWCKDGVDGDYLPSREELGKLEFSEACLRVRIET